MTRKAFAGLYRCPRNHEGAQYFFDSQLIEVPCGFCDGVAKLVRQIIDRDPHAARKAKKRPKVAA
jgi:hypothetical protein